jgi:hypothetical protein
LPPLSAICELLVARLAIPNTAYDIDGNKAPIADTGSMSTHVGGEATMGRERAIKSDQMIIFGTAINLAETVNPGRALAIVKLFRSIVRAW